jgi:hypothetical protein
MAEDLQPLHEQLKKTPDLAELRKDLIKRLETEGSVKEALSILLDDHVITCIKTSEPQACNNEELQALLEDLGISHLLDSLEHRDLKPGEHFAGEDQDINLVADVDVFFRCGYYDGQGFAQFFVESEDPELQALAQPALDELMGNKDYVVCHDVEEIKKFILLFAKLFRELKKYVE